MVAISTGAGLAIAAGVSAAAAGGGAAISANASRRAARTQARAGRRAQDVELEMFERTREDLAPYREAGRPALAQLSAGTAPGGAFAQPFTMADFQEDPGYNFRLQEGAKAIERSAASRGTTFSGATLKDLQRFGQGLASEEYGRAFDRFHGERTARFNRLAALAGLGQTAATTTGHVGTQVASNIGQTTQAIGNVQAAGQVGAANALSQGIAGVGGAANTAAQNYLLLQALHRPQYPLAGGRSDILLG